jgi:NRAMP (natural resistance-associated macrophage protein)-like metal ion transporter
MGDDAVNLRKVVKTLAVFGPAVLVSVELFDPASIVTATAAGATYGFPVLWAALYSGILLIVIQEISARVGVVTGKTLSENIYQTYGKHYSLSLFIPSIFLEFATLTAEVMGLSLAISFIFMVPYYFAVFASFLIVAVLTYFGSYSALEKVIVFFVTIIFLAYLYFVFELSVPLGTIVVDSLVPPLSVSSLYYAEAIMGASIMPTYVVLHSGLVYEKGWVHHHEKSIEELVSEQKGVTSERVDSVVSLLLGTILNIVIIASAAVLISGIQVSTYQDIAYPFYNRLGNFGLVIFSLAFGLAGVSAIVTVGLGSVYSTFGYLGYEEKLKKRRFKLVFILWLLIAAIGSFIPNQIEVMVFTQYLNGALLPFVVLPLLLIGRKKNVMGKYRLGKISTVAVGVIIVITTLLFFGSLVSLI